MDEKGASNADEYETELIFWLPDHVQLVVIEVIKITAIISAHKSVDLYTRCG